MLGTHWEQEEKTQNNSHHPTPKMRKTRSIMNACWAFSLAAWNFNFQNCLSPFSTWAHTPLLKDWGTYWHKWHKCTIHSYFYGQSAFYNSHHPTPKMKKQGPSWMHAEPSRWLHEIFISKTVCHHFQRGLIPPSLKTGGLIDTNVISVRYILIFTASLLFTTPTTPPRKWKKQGPSWMHAEPSCWLHEISISKTVCHHFQRGLITPPLKDWGTYWHKCHKCTIHSYFYGQSAFYNSHHPTRKVKKTRPIVNACWAFSLAAWNFYFQNCLSPFSTWAHTPP